MTDRFPIKRLFLIFALGLGCAGARAAPVGPTSAQFIASILAAEEECASAYPEEAIYFRGIARGLIERYPELGRVTQDAAYAAELEQARGETKERFREVGSGGSRVACDAMRYREGEYAMAGPPPAGPLIDETDARRPERFTVRVAFFGERYVERVKALNGNGELLDGASLMQAYHKERYAPTSRVASSDKVAPGVAIPAYIDLSWNPEGPEGTAGAKRWRRFEVRSSIPADVIDQSRKYRHLLFLVLLLDDKDAHFAWVLEATDKQEGGNTPARRMLRHGGASHLIFCHWPRTWVGAPTATEAGGCR